MVYAASIHTELDKALADILLFSLMFSYALFMSLLLFKFSKAANLFETLL